MDNDEKDKNLCHVRHCVNSMGTTELFNNASFAVQPIGNFITFGAWIMQFLSVKKNYWGERRKASIYQVIPNFWALY